MANAFPGGIRSKLLRRGYDGPKYRDVVERSQPELGSVMTHLRYTAAERVWVGISRQKNATDAAAFDTHFNTTLKFGSLPGDWVEPDGGTTVSVLIKKLGSWKQGSGVTRQIKLEMTEVLS